MIAVMLFSYIIALLCKGKRWMVAIGVTGNIALLAIFKYSGFAITTLNSIFNIELPSSNISLPIGISFFIFQAVSYLIDVYRGDVPASKSLLNVTLYISFFPQLIAGPIIRYHDVEKQINRRRASTSDICIGIRRFCIGLSKKVLIADVMAKGVDAIYSSQIDNIGFYAAWMAALFYTMQIYFDFSGYSDMAIGMARMFGFKYKENFNYPLISTSIKEFWRRWHISLSTWFKEYLYIPLGGNRISKERTVLNKILVFFICGLWHGAAVTFVIWGLLHGGMLLLEEYLPLNKVNRYIKRIFTLLFIVVTFAIFRSDNMSIAITMIAKMFQPTTSNYDISLALQQVEPLAIFTFIVAIMASTPLKIKVMSILSTTPEPTQLKAKVASYLSAFSLLIFSMLTLSASTYSPFIYFRF